MHELRRLRTVDDRRRDQDGEPDDCVHGNVHPPEERAVRVARLERADLRQVVDVAVITLKVDRLIAEPDQQDHAGGRDGQKLGHVCIVVAERLRGHLSAKGHEENRHRHQAASDARLSCVGGDDGERCLPHEYDNFPSVKAFAAFHNGGFLRHIDADDSEKMERTL